MILLTSLQATFPIENPVLKFLIILLIILLGPVLLNRFKIPHILGLIISGAIVGPHGFNLILRDSSIILSGTAGLLYIMFLAGLDIDLFEFKKNRNRSLLFGLYTFTIPMVLGVILGFYILDFTLMTSILLASMFASHTLIAYPIINKIGIARNRSVTVTIGGTMITDMLALLVLAIIVGMTQGVVNTYFWVKLICSILLFGSFILIGFPIIARFFFRYYSDSVSQYIFVLMMVFFGAVLAEFAGIESIIGAFLSGLALNKLIPRSSPLMNRIEFIGNAIFIPFFLIGVGMLINYKVFLLDSKTIIVAILMTFVATLSKFLAAYIAQKTFGFTKNERTVMFGLSNAQAAATLAAVLVGYNIITGQTPDGEPIRLLNESILNGTIIMIFITCTIATFAAQRGGQKLSIIENSLTKDSIEQNPDKILISLSNPKNVEELVGLACAFKSEKQATQMAAINVIVKSDDEEDQIQFKKSQKILDLGVNTASAADVYMNTHMRCDVNFTNGIMGVVREQKTTDLVLGIDKDAFLNKASLGRLINGIIGQGNMNTFIYRSEYPLAIIKRHILIVPPLAENEIGFPYWISKIWNLARSTNVQITVYANERTINIIKKINESHPIALKYMLLPLYSDLLIISNELKKDDLLIFVLSKKQGISYDNCMDNIPHYIDANFRTNNFLLLYPIQNAEYDEMSDLINPSGMNVFNNLDKLTSSIIRMIGKIR